MNSSFCAHPGAGRPLAGEGGITPKLCIVALGATPQMFWVGGSACGSRQSRTCSTEVAFVTVSLMCTVACTGLMLEPPPADPAIPPGGYWSVGEQRTRAGEPDDGEDQLTIGSVLFSLGLLRLGAAGVTIWMAEQPRFCPPDDPSTNCGPLRTYGWVGVGEGALMFTTGIVYLAIGARHRQRYAAWRRGEPLSLQVGRHGARLSARPFLVSSRRALPGQNATNRELSGAHAPTLDGGGLRFELRF